MPIEESDTRIRLLKTAFVIYYHTDLDKARKFLLDFGLEIAFEKPGEEIFFKGYGTEPFVYIARRSPSATSEFGGAAYEVESRHELERAALVPGATPDIVKLDNFPGGGEMVTLTDPRWPQSSPRPRTVTTTASGRSQLGKTHRQLRRRKAAQGTLPAL